MQLSEIINSSSVLPNLKASSKRQLLQELANEGARITGIEAQVIFETLLRREKLGSTGLGEGIAIPHGKFPSLDRGVCAPCHAGEIRICRRQSGRSGVPAAGAGKRRS
jgi:PTS system nitrogen regulatory IIA component